MSTASARPAAWRRVLVVLVVLSTLLTVGVATVSAVAVAAGYRDHSYNFTSVISTPTRDKPQSKVWYTDGFWWAGLVASPGDTFIHQYNAAAHTWTNTGVAVDTRNSSQADYLWDAGTNSLYVASAAEDESAGPIRVFKLNYNPTTNTYSHDSDFGAAGVDVGNGPTETVTIARDSTGQLWVSYTNPVGDATTDRNVMINRSTGPEDVWGTPFALANGRVSGDDISSIIAFGGNSVGVMWSNHIPSGGQTGFYFSSHGDAAGDTTWSARQVVALGTGGSFVEDHINLKLAGPGSGTILAAVKTNGGGENFIRLLERNPSNGSWSVHTVVNGDATRPQLVVNTSNSTVYVMYGSPEDQSAPADQAVYYKAAALNSLIFPSGAGTRFIGEAGINVLDVSTAKHPVTNAMGGILAIASGETNRSYYHGWIPLGGPPPTPPANPENPFVDIGSSQFKNDIIWAYNEGITSGCATNRYCPKGLVTRAQMATFLVRALDLPSTSHDYFSDDNNSVHENNINALRAAGVTAGCAAGLFCPDGIVARGQMATFLVRGFDLPASNHNFFTDDNSSIHENNINALAAAGITHGCTATTFCPNGLVNREQMAAFLHRAAD